MSNTESTHETMDPIEQSHRQEALSKDNEFAARVNAAIEEIADDCGISISEISLDRQLQVRSDYRFFQYHLRIQGKPFARGSEDA